MTAPFPSLVRYYVLSLYAPARREGDAEGGLAKKGGGLSVKKTAKTFGIVALAIFLAADIGSIFVGMDLAMYSALKPRGLQGLLLLDAVTTASAFVFVLGFVTALSTYCMSRADAGLLAMPLSGRSILGAKMAMVYLSELAFSAFLVLIACVIYAVMESPPPTFYAGAILAAIAVPLLPLAAIYFILVPLMASLRPLRSKRASMIIGGVVGSAFALALNLYIQGANSRASDHAWILAALAGPDAILARAGFAYPPALLAWKSMTAAGAAGPGFGAANLALGLAAVALVAFGLGGPYARSLVGFDEFRLKRKAATKDLFERSFRRRSPTLALLLREIRLMNREPVYFLNGPFVILLMPAILAVALLAQRSALGELMASLGSFKRGPGAMLAAAALGAFLGSSTNICSTAVSRDAKALPYLKALPLRYRDIALAKFLHGFAFALVGAAVGALGGSLLLGLSATDSAGAFLLATAFSAFACIAGLWLDTANPRLSWDNPAAALKQNPNSIFAILGVLAILGGLGALSAILSWSRPAFFWVYFAAFAGLASAALAAYPRFAERRIAEMET